MGLLIIRFTLLTLRQRMNALKTSAFFFCSSGDFALLVVGIVKAE